MILRLPAGAPARRARTFRKIGQFSRQWLCYAGAMKSSLLALGVAAAVLLFPVAMARSAAAELPRRGFLGVAMAPDRQTEAGATVTEIIAGGTGAATCPSSFGWGLRRGCDDVEPRSPGVGPSDRPPVQGEIENIAHGRVERTPGG